MKSIFILPLFLFINIVVLAQKATEILPNSITLPRLSTTEQNTIPPQQAGNIIYNADEKKLALHDGTNWNYLTSNTATNGFKKIVLLYNSQSWTVPAGISKIRVELWGGGEAGTAIQNLGAVINCQGGRGAAYALYELNVTPNEVLTITVSPGGYSGSMNNEYSTEIKRNNMVIAKAALYTFDSTPYEGLLNIVEGENGYAADFSFQQVSTGVFRKILRTGAGGGTYPYFKNGGHSTTVEYTVPDGILVGVSYNYNSTSGEFGGGGACAHTGHSYGGAGIIKIYY